MADILDKPAYTRFGDYVLVRVLGRRTHSALYQAFDPRTGRMVVIKIVHFAASAGPDAATAQDNEPVDILAARLRREANALALLSHPCVLTVHESGELRGRPYLAMEYVNGQTLRQHLSRGPLPLEEAVGILEQVAGALDAAHAQGILHRNVKPSSVMISLDGRVKLIDFGLARQHNDIAVTLMGELVGEPTRVAPELLRGEEASEYSDLWSLGVLLYEMLAGQPPFQGTNFALVAQQVARGTPAPVPGVSDAVQRVVTRALEKDAGKRYQRAGDMASALRAAVKTSRPAPRFHENPRTRTALVVGGISLAAAAVIGVILAALAPWAHPHTETVDAATRPVPPSAPAVQAPAVQMTLPAAVPPANGAHDPFKPVVPQVLSPAAAPQTNP